MVLVEGDLESLLVGQQRRTWIRRKELYFGLPLSVVAGLGLAAGWSRGRRLSESSSHANLS